MQNIYQPTNTHLFIHVFQQTDFRPTQTEPAPGATGSGEEGAVPTLKDWVT